MNEFKNPEHMTIAELLQQLRHARKTTDELILNATKLINHTEDDVYKERKRHDSRPN